MRHGFKNTKIYNSWRGMRERCNNPNHVRYSCYGGKGVKVCSAWDNFMTFYEWAIRNGYKEGLTIDRVDNNGHYEPCNCRWATRKEQMHNSSRNRDVTINGATKRIYEWAEEFNLSYNTFKRRLYREGAAPNILRPVKVYKSA